MRIGITGPSELTYNEEQFVADTTFDFLTDFEPPPTEFWSGCAYGADTIGLAAALRARVPLLGLTIPSGAWHNENLVRELQKRVREWGDYDYQLEIERTKQYPHSPDAYHRRNDLTIKHSDVLLVFPPSQDEPSQRRGHRGAGTWSTARKARKKGLGLWFFPLDGKPAWHEDGILTLDSIR